MSPLVAGGLGFAIALVLTPLLRLVAHRLNLLDRPNERSSHVRPTPRSGGLAICAAVAVVAITGRVTDDRTMVVVLGGAGIVALTGLIDDFRGLRAWQKFLGQLAGAVLFILYGQLVGVSLAGATALSWLGVTIAFVWLIGLTNAYNFMDGINGIAALQAAITSVATVLVLISRSGVQHESDVLILAALGGGALGFLPFNFPSGSIFLGDVGSGAVGFLLAAIVVRLRGTPCAFLVALFSLVPFLLDSFATFLRRLVNHEPIFSPHRSHFYQRLTILGWSHARVTLLWGSLALIGSGLGYVVCDRSWGFRLASLAALLLVHGALAAAITMRERAVARSSSAASESRSEV